MRNYYNFWIEKKEGDRRLVRTFCMLLVLDLKLTYALQQKNTYVMQNVDLKKNHLEIY